MSDCKGCVSTNVELERVMAAYEQESMKNERKDQLIAELLAENEQLKSSAAVAFDPNHVFVDTNDDDLHAVQEFEEEREQELVNQLPAFFTLFKKDECFLGFLGIYCANLEDSLVFTKQVDQKIRYDAFSKYKKRLFWYLWLQHDSMVAQEPAKAYLSRVSRSVALRVICDLADIDNEPSGPQACWVANKRLVKKDGRALLFFDSETLE